jgi:hypothetical protein
MDEDNKPLETDSSEETHQEEGSEDVAGKGEVNLSLDELNTLAGRKDNPFKTKEEFAKHYGNLKSFVGDQELAKERKEAKEVKNDNVKENTTAQELAELKKDIAKKDFLLETPTAKEYMDILEAYAEKNNLTLGEAWETKFKTIAESSQKKVIINKNRINPVESQRVSELAKSARGGDENAQNALIEELVWKK